MKFNLWDIEVGRYLGQFDDEKEALSLVRMLLQHHGEAYAEELGLGRVSDEGEILESLSGTALVARIDAVFVRDEDERDRPTAVRGSRRQGPRPVASREPLAAAIERANDRQR
jgi:hypothetical protein